MMTVVGDHSAQHITAVSMRILKSEDVADVKQRTHKLVQFLKLLLLYVLIILPRESEGEDCWQVEQPLVVCLHRALASVAILLFL